MIDDDQHLVKEASAGNHAAFEVLVDKYSNAVQAMAISVVKDFFLAEDVTQETFIKAWFNLTALKEPSKFKSWLLTTARRLSLNAVKSRHYRMLPLNLKEVDSGVRLEDHIMAKENKREVKKALDSLNEKNRETILLYYMGGYKLREIAALTNESVDAIESRLRRVRKILKKELFDMVETTLQQNNLSGNFKNRVMSQIQSVAYIYVRVTDVSRSTSWYVNCLGCDSPHIGLVRLPYGPQIELWNDEKGQPPAASPKPIFGFYTPEINRYYEELKANEVNVSELNNGGPCGITFEVRDPDGNVFEVWGGFQDHRKMKYFENQYQKS